MNSELKQSEYADGTSPDVEVSINVQETGKTNLLPPSTDSGQWKQIGEEILDFFSELSAYVLAFVKEKPLTAIGLFLVAAVSVKLTLAILDALNDLPLVAPTFELVGIGYAAWFTFRYLWKASSRKELSDQIGTLKNQILGEK